MIFPEPSEERKELESKFIGLWSGIVGRENMLKFYGGTDEEAEEVYEFYLSEITKIINEESRRRRTDGRKPIEDDGTPINQITF